MDETLRTEYPTMLASLQPSQAVHTFNERFRRIHKINTEIADWLAERRRVEEQYAQSMRRLAQFKVPNAQSALGIFQPPWDRIITSVESTAQAHQTFADRLERDVESSLRQFPTRSHSQNVSMMSSSVGSLARELDDATDKADRLQRRAGRANPSKVEAASTRLEAAQRSWDSQAPFVFESLQALDELRVDHLRDVLTQMLTHEADAATKRGEIVADVLAGLIEVQTTDEIKVFVAHATSAKAKAEKRGVAPPRAPIMPSSSSSTGLGAAGASGSEPRVSSAGASLSVPSSGAAAGGGDAGGSAGGPADDDISDSSVREVTQNNSVFRRIGTVLGRRRQSVHGGFSQVGSGFTRQLNSSHNQGRASPRTSSHHLPESSNRLGSLAEIPDAPAQHEQPKPANSHGATSGAAAPATWQSADHLAPRASSAGNPNTGGLVDPSIFDAVPSSAVGRAAPGEPAKDAEGFTIVPSHANDPISQAQREASGNAADDDMVENMFKVSIQNKPLAEEDPEEKRAALSNVATTLSQMAMPLPSRKLGTVRGRRDVRNTLYVPPSAMPSAMPSSAIPSAIPSVIPLATAPSSSVFDSEAAGSNNPFTLAPPPPPAMLPTSSTMSSAMSMAKSPSVVALASETSAAGTSDTQSVRSANSLASGGGVAHAHAQHPSLAAPGLNASVIETVSATFVDGEIRSVGILGEIAFAYGAPGGGLAPNSHETIRINNFSNLGSIGPNRLCVSNTPTPDQWTLDTSHLTRTTTAAFSYRVFSESSSTSVSPTSSAFSPISFSSLAHSVPLVLKPAWKPDGDKLGLLLQYGSNPACTLPGPVTLRNVVIVASYLGGRGARAQTKPGGTHLGDKGLVYWRLGDLTVDPATGLGEGKIVCRVFGLDSSVELKPGHFEARWEFSPIPAPAEAGTAVSALASGISISRLVEGEKTGGEDEGEPPSEDQEGPNYSDPFADENPGTPALPPPEGKRWVDVPLVRKLVSGKYEARAPGSERVLTGQTPSTPVIGGPASPTSVPASA